MTEPVAPTMENIALTLDNGAVLDFRGRLFSEASWFDEDSGVLTHHGRKRAGLFRCQRHRQNAQPASVPDRGSGRYLFRHGRQIRNDASLRHAHAGSSFSVRAGGKCHALSGTGGRNSTRSQLLTLDISPFIRIF